MSTIVANFYALYGFQAPRRLVALYRQAGGPLHYIGTYWTTQNFAAVEPDTSAAYAGLSRWLGIGMLCQLLLGLVLVYTGIVDDRAGLGYFGTAIVLSYPIVWAQLLFFGTIGWRVIHPKRTGKALLTSILEGQVRTLRSRNEFSLVAVAGSVGKTSTKLAIAQVLAASGRRVRYQEGNYNDRLTVPLIFFGETEPGIYNLPAWLALVWRTSRALKRAYPYDVVVVELGTDGPGQIAQFAYLHPELSVVTAVAEEHMEYFDTIEAVAREELSVFEYSARVLVNTDDVPAHFLQYDSYQSYGAKPSASYKVKLDGGVTASGQKLTVSAGLKKMTVQTHFLGEQGAKIILAAATVADMLDVEWSSLAPILESLQPFAGRMQLLAGVEGSTLIDDTYNASPSAVRAALDVLYSMDSPQRIAILGSMNELGDISPAAHADIGAYCDPQKLSLVVTIGAEAKTHLAPAAAQAGCEVKSYTDAHKAGKFVQSQLKKYAVVLAKGSQNGVFAEEALKPLLADKADQANLVRQSDYWMRLKRS